MKRKLLIKSPLVHSIIILVINMRECDLMPRVIWVILKGENPPRGQTVDSRQHPSLSDGCFLFS